jgi:hypothetical protein
MTDKQTVSAEPMAIIQKGRVIVLRPQEITEGMKLYSHDAMEWLEKGLAEWRDLAMKWSDRLRQAEEDRDGNLKSAAHFGGENMDLRHLLKEILPHLLAARHAAETRMDNENESEPYMTLDAIVTEVEDTLKRKK